jgi:hypothetical protein
MMKALLQRLTFLKLSNKSLQLLSLLLAIICWYGIQGVTDSDSTVYKAGDDADGVGRSGRSVILPIGVIAPSRSGAVRISVEPKSATVQIEEGGGNPGEFAAAKLSPFVDCSDIVTSGKYRLPLNCISPGRSSVIDIEPKSVTVTVEFVD